jgi:hypothetical protein
MNNSGLVDYSQAEDAVDVAAGSGRTWLLNSWPRKYIFRMEFYPE